MAELSALGDDLGNLKWQQLLRVFKKIIENDPIPETVKEQLERLKSQAKNDNYLSIRQVEGIIDRCNNYLNGNYGNTKKPEHYDHSKPSQK